MERIITNTTDFKRNLKTVTDMLTASEARDYDLGIYYKYDKGELLFSAEHPVHSFQAEAKFEADSDLDEASICGFFHLGELSERLKKYRRKEDFYIDTTNTQVIFSTNEQVVYETERKELEVNLDEPEQSYQVNRKAFIDLLNLSRSVNETTFHDSTMLVRMILNKNLLVMMSNNLSQMSYASQVLDKPTERALEFGLPVQQLTRVRNTVARGKGDNVAISIVDNRLFLATNTTRLILQNYVPSEYVEFGSIISGIQWRSDVYHLAVDLNTKTVKEAYDKLMVVEKDDESSKETEQEYSELFIDVEEENKTISFTTEKTSRQVLVKDVHSFIGKVPSSKLEVALSDNALLFNSAGEKERFMIILPFNVIG